MKDIQCELHDLMEQAPHLRPLIGRAVDYIAHCEEMNSYLVDLCENVYEVDARKFKTKSDTPRA